MNKLLISLLSLTGIAGISTGGYFLLKGNSTEANSEGEGTKAKPSGGGGGSDSPEATVESPGSSESPPSTGAVQ